jgi:hypothetical protein
MMHTSARIAGTYIVTAAICGLLLAAAVGYPN